MLLIHAHKTRHRIIRFGGNTFTLLEAQMATARTQIIALSRSFYEQLYYSTFPTLNKSLEVTSDVAQF